MRKFFSLLTILTLSAVVAQAAPRPTNRQLANFYVANHKDLAVFEHIIFGIPASVTLAQGILESVSGTTRLATEGNNHFGIKCGTGNCDKPMYLKDDDRNKQGRLIPSPFRTFNSVPESYRAHSLLLKNSTRYARLFTYDRTDYVRWARGLQEFGYATDPMYADKLIRIIRQYQLDQYDLPEVLSFDMTENEEEALNAQELEDEKAAETPPQYNTTETVVERAEASFETAQTQQKMESKRDNQAADAYPMPAKTITHNNGTEKVTYTLYEFVSESSAKTVTPRKNQPAAKQK